jgi:hypothetical protein
MLEWYFSSPAIAVEKEIISQAACFRQALTGCGNLSSHWHQGYIKVSLKSFDGTT